MNDEEAKKIEQEADRQNELDALEPISIEEYEERVNKWLLIEDPYILRILPYHYIANCLPGDPVWLMINGASGGGKSELLYLFNDLPKIYQLSTLTPQTLVSGTQGKADVSLLPKLSGKIIVMKDFTTIMSMQIDAQKEIISQLREIYDGRFTKAFGTGKVIDWKGKVGMIAASTEQYDMFAMYNSAMGERFIQYRLVTGDREKTADRAITNTNNVEQMRKEMRHAMYALIKGVNFKDEVTPLPDDVRQQLIKLANLACLARSSVIRDKGMKHEVIFVPTPEMPTRLTQQLVRFVQAAMLVRHGEVHEEDMAAVYKIALDSIPKRERAVMKQLTYKNSQTTTEIAMGIGYPTGTAHTVLEDLSVRKMVDRIKGTDSEEGGTSDRWVLKEDFRDVLAFYDKIKKEEVAIDELAKEFGGVVVPDIPM